MNGRAYYNERDPFAAQWLRNLVSAGRIASGDVDERDIRDVRAVDLDGYAQCHFFAGVGVWSLALRNAGWPDDRPVWTGSCPCQPFSAAGKGAGFDDDRHLWPTWFDLIRERGPGVVFGEQVASKDGLSWLDLVQSDLEGAGYACGALDICAAGFGAPHIRQRLYFVADRDGVAGGQGRPFGDGRPDRSDAGEGAGPGGGGGVDVMDDDDDARLERFAGHGDGRPERPLPSRSVAAAGAARALADIEGERRIGRQDDGNEERRELASRPEGAIGGLAHGDGRIASAEELQRSGQHGQQQTNSCSAYEHRGSGPTNGLWRDADWLLCRDGKWRPVEPGTFPLAHGIAGRVGKLRAYGNAIVEPQARAFIEAYCEARHERL